MSLPSLSVHHRLDTLHLPTPDLCSMVSSSQGENSMHSRKKQRTQAFVLLSCYLNLTLDTILIWCFLHILHILQWRVLFPFLRKKKKRISFHNCGDSLCDISRSWGRCRKKKSILTRITAVNVPWCEDKRPPRRGVLEVPSFSLQSSAITDAVLLYKTTTCPMLAMPFPIFEGKF